MLRPGRLVAAGEDVGRLGDGLGGEAPLDVLVRHEVSVGMHQRRAGHHGLLGALDGREHLVGHFHELFRLFQNLRRLGGDDADGVAQVVGHAAHGDHGVPVLFKVSHLVLPGNVCCGEHAHHARQGFGLLGVDGVDDGAGIGRADGGGIDHAVQIDVVGVLAVAQDLFPHVQPVDGLAQRPVGIQGRDFALALELCGQTHGLDDLHIAGAAADVVLDGGGALFLGGIVVDIQKRLGAHDHARDAEAALHRARRAEGVGIELLFKVGKPLHGEDVLAFQLVGLLDAGAHGLALQQHRTCAAGALATAVLHGGQAHLIPEKPDELLIFLHRDRCTVDKKCSHIDSSCPCGCRAHSCWRHGDIDFRSLFNCIVPSFSPRSKARSRPKCRKFQKLFSNTDKFLAQNRLLVEIPYFPQFKTAKFYAFHIK